MNHQETRRVGFLSNKYIPSKKSGFDACISSRITTVIHVVGYHQINYNWFNEPYAVSQYRYLYLDMHGLIFETSIWLLAGSTRYLTREFHCWNTGKRANAPQHNKRQHQWARFGATRATTTEPHQIVCFVLFLCMSIQKKWFTRIQAGAECWHPTQNRSDLDIVFS